MSRYGITAAPGTRAAVTRASSTAAPASRA